MKPGSAPVLPEPEEAIPDWSEVTVTLAQPQLEKVIPGGPPNEANVTGTPATGSPRLSVTETAKGGVVASEATSFGGRPSAERDNATGMSGDPATTAAGGVWTLAMSQPSLGPSPWLRPFPWLRPSPSLRACRDSPSTCTDGAADGGKTDTRTPVTSLDCHPTGNFTTVRTWPLPTSGKPVPMSLRYQVWPPASLSPTARDDTPFPEESRSTTAYCRKSPGCGDAGSLEILPYQRSTSSFITL